MSKDGSDIATDGLWYAIHTKPKQEDRALKNLERQGYTCYLPMIKRQVARASGMTVVCEPLFPRYLFISLRSDGSQNWAPIRSTRGVSRLVTFGLHPAQVDHRLIMQIQAHEVAQGGKAESLFQSDEVVRVTDGPFDGMDAIYQIADGERRALVLIEILGKSIRLKIHPGKLRKRSSL